jgi:transcriptional regulator with XRE-family HTH domain
LRKEKKCLTKSQWILYQFFDTKSNFFSFEDYGMGIGQRLRQVILLKNKTLKDFTSKADIRYLTLQRYLSGNSKLHADVLIKVITHLDVNVNWLLTGEGPMYCHQLKEPIKEKKEEIKEINEDRVAYGADKSPGLDDELNGFKSHWSKLNDEQKRALMVVVKEMVKNNNEILMEENRRLKDFIIKIATKTHGEIPLNVVQGLTD